MEFKSFLHFGNSGDCIAALPAIKELAKKSGKKANYYLFKNRKAIYYQGAVHPVKDDAGTMVMLNDKMIEMLIPLFKQQDYIEDAKEWSGEEIDVDLNKIRETNVNCPYGDLRRWYFYPFPNLSCDLSKQYIEVPDLDTNISEGKIIVNRTERYTNELISYFFLKKYEPNVIFAGTKGEYEKFCKEWKLDIPYLEVGDFLELAQIIKQAKLFVGNQSMCFQIAEGLKIPRICELCHFAPNVIPTGEYAYDFYAQVGLEYYVDYLFNL